MKSVREYAGNEKAGILKEVGLKVFDRSTIETYRRYLNKMNGPVGSYMRPASIICWDFYCFPYYMIAGDFFILVLDNGFSGRIEAYTPIGDYRDTDGLRRALEQLEEIFKRLETEPELGQVKEWMKPWLEKTGKYEFTYTYDECESDYTYDMEKFGKYIDKHSTHYDNAIKTFTESWEPVMCDYSEEDHDAIMKIVEEKYCNGEGCEGCVYGCMKKFYDRIIECISDIDGRIIVFKSGTEVIAFAVLVLDCGELFGFALQSIPGLKGFTEYYYKYKVDTYAGAYEVMNIGEDMGEPGIRLHKRGLGPYVLSHSFYAALRRK